MSWAYRESAVCVLCNVVEVGKGEEGRCGWWLPVLVLQTVFPYNFQKGEKKRIKHILKQTYLSVYNTSFALVNWLID